jgi:hypothetical protein
MKINFQTPNLIMAVYPGGAGGKFLLNCIGVSKQGLLQDYKLTVAQLGNLLLSEDKKKLILERLSDTKNKWVDLDLGCWNFFGVGHDEYFYNHIDNPDYFCFFPTVAQVTNNTDLKFSVVAHTMLTAEKMLELWSNATVLLLDNHHKFIKTYRPKYLYNNRLWQYWKNVRAENWPELPPRTKQEYNQFDYQIQHDLETIHSNEIEQYLKDEKTLIREIELNQLIQNKIVKNNKIINWDCNWYFDVDATVDGVREIYNRLELPDFDQEFTINYYKLWIDKIQNIKE